MNLGAPKCWRIVCHICAGGYWNRSEVRLSVCPKTLRHSATNSSGRLALAFSSSAIHELLKRLLLSEIALRTIVIVRCALALAAFASLSTAHAEHAYHVTFTNITKSELTLTYAGDECMHEHGPETIRVMPGESSSPIELRDSGSLFDDCTSATKGVEWRGEFEADERFVNPSFKRTRHDGLWWTQVSGGARNVHFLATCGGDECDSADGKGGDNPGAIRVIVGP
ncbi:hypothetical protein PAN31117_05077 [Pandoraea anapnoica]|uniref:Uncharacterized protein n=1 Tax=Pandoraea anapnoica TaxID=2508301 RepID=A0A5E5AR90_9BURK|nr:hypothetical protein PIN31009_05323 [Pandoraea iniqua]VVE75085.1 hypothetical protein PAN31117_05077 [Pandoraea anapnoica]